MGTTKVPQFRQNFLPAVRLARQHGLLGTSIVAKCRDVRRRSDIAERGRELRTGRPRGWPSLCRPQGHSAGAAVRPCRTKGTGFGLADRGVWRCQDVSASSAPPPNQIRPRSTLRHVLQGWRQLLERAPGCLADAQGLPARGKRCRGGFPLGWAPSEFVRTLQVSLLRYFPNNPHCAWVFQLFQRKDKGSYGGSSFSREEDVAGHGDYRGLSTPRRRASRWPRRHGVRPRRTRARLCSLCERPARLSRSRLATASRLPPCCEVTARPPRIAAS